MTKKDFESLWKEAEGVQKEDEEAARAMQNRIVSRMVETARRESDRLEHHLLELPLPVILYQWFIIRLKRRPWRILVPASMIVTLLLQGLLGRVNFLQLLGR
jgi:hypothetical protein